MLNFKNKLILAPMAEITQLPFRLLCKKFGADIVITEMISANALARKNKRTLELIKTTKKEKPVGLQLFGANTQNILKSIRLVKDSFDFVDINFGCPALKIVKQGAGSYLLQRPKKINEILSKAIKLDIPITIKIRSGFKELNYLEIGKIAEDNNISAITLHARTQIQGYTGKANWDHIKELKLKAYLDIYDDLDYIHCKQQLIYFSKGIKNIKQLRQKLNKIKTKEEIKKIINEV